MQPGDGDQREPWLRRAAGKPFRILMISLPMHCVAPPSPRTAPWSGRIPVTVTGPHVIWMGGAHKIGSKVSFSDVTASLSLFV